MIQRILVSRHRAHLLSAYSECVYTNPCTRDTRLLCVRLRNGQSCGVRRGAVVSFPRRRQSSGLRAKRPSIAFQLVIPAWFFPSNFEFFLGKTIP